MHNNKIKELFNKWASNEINKEELYELFNGIISKLLEKKDDDLTTIVNQLSPNMHENFYNLLSICSSHQILTLNDGSGKMAGQYQIILPITFYPEDYEDNLIVIDNLSHMIINKYASDFLEASGFSENGEFYAYPYLIPEDELQMKFSDIFHLPFNIHERELSGEGKKINIEKPMTYYIYGRLFIPDFVDVFNLELEKKFENPVSFAKESQNISSMIEAFFKIKGSDMKAIVGSPSTIPYVLSNIDALKFVSNIVMSYHINKYYLCDDIVAEISTFDNETTILLYANKKCVLVHKLSGKYYNGINNDSCYDNEYFKLILKKLNLKKIRFSKRKFGNNFNEIIGQDILSVG